MITLPRLFLALALVAISCGNTSPGGDLTSWFPADGGGLTGGSNVGAVTNVGIRRDCTGTQILKWDGDSWECASDETSGGGGTGDIDGVTAGDALSGGGTSGTLTLDVEVGSGLEIIGDAVAITDACGDGQLLKSTSGLWSCASDNDSGDITGITAGNGLTGGGTSGAITLDVACVSNSLTCNANDIGLASRDFGSITVGSSGTTMTIDNDAVSLGMMANMAPGFIGRDDGTTGDPEHLSTGQATALLTQFSPSTTSQGVVPGANGCGSGCVLFANQTWGPITGVLGSGDGIEINSNDIEIRQDCNPLDVLQWRDADNEGPQPYRWMCTPPGSL